MKPLVAIVILAFLVSAGPAAGGVPFEQALNAVPVRELGPANMGGRVTALAVAESRPRTMYVGTAAGGLWKTVNNGTTWKAVFEHETTASVGDVAVAPSNPDVVWVGTGEANPRNSVSWGDGVYRSVDGGKTWQRRGLRETAHIGRVLIHPASPDLVYVAALGRVWGANRLRGVFKTADGGQSWQNVFYVNDDTGAIDLAMDPSDPETLYVAAWQCRRGPFAGGNPAVQTGPGSALYKTSDGGRTWLRLSAGLPGRPLGRCGLSVYRRDPRVVYAVVQTDLTDASNLGQRPRTGSDPSRGGVFRSEDGGMSWIKLNDLCPRPFYFGQIRVDPYDDRRVYVLGRELYVSDDGGRTFREPAAPHTHVDHHALGIDPRDPDHLVLGGDGGLNLSYDRGATWQNIDQLPIGQFYGVAVDNCQPYRIYGGLQDNGSWGGPSATRRPEGVTSADWFSVLGADGFRCQVDPSDRATIYAETQYGGLHRVNVATGQDREIAPPAPRGGPPYRFHWDAPIIVSPHDPQTLYFGGNHLFRSTDRGDHWREISPDLTRGRPGPSPDTGHALTAVAESPLRAGLLYVGADDGRVHVSRDGGGSWIEVSNRLPGLSADGWVTCVTCSHRAEGTAYLAVDRHCLDDPTPYLFRTDDHGRTWRSLAKGLPATGPIHVVREDPRNGNLLFVGTEFGLFVSPDGGASWHQVRGRLPTVPVRDLAIQERERELVIGTHGRSLYVMDLLPLEALASPIHLGEAALFDVRPAIRFTSRGWHGRYGDNFFAAPNPPYGAVIWYYLGAPQPPGAVRLTVQNARGDILAILPAADTPGLHRAVWGLSLTASLGPIRVQVPVNPGEYLIRLEAGGPPREQRVRVGLEN